METHKPQKKRSIPINGTIRHRDVPMLTLEEACAMLRPVESRNFPSREENTWTRSRSAVIVLLDRRRIRKRLQFVATLTSEIEAHIPSRPKALENLERGFPVRGAGSCAAWRVTSPKALAPSGRVMDEILKNPPTRYRSDLSSLSPVASSARTKFGEE